ncbi:MAG TPA: hypothetical protein VER33_20790 [Polyangiaceae bacterium]|nr:hypothetical protein [Polyangiaceae bacterium]
MSRWLAYGFGLGLVGLVIAPVFAEPGWDSFPLSSYPMFATKRDKPQLYYVEALSRDGASERLEPRFVANDEVLQAASAVRRAVRRGEPGMARLCGEVARRLRASEAHAHLTRVQIVSARFDPIAYFVEGPAPLGARVHYRCAVRAAE